MHLLFSHFAVPGMRQFSLGHPANLPTLFLLHFETISERHDLLAGYQGQEKQQKFPSNVGMDEMTQSASDLQEASTGGSPSFERVESIFFS